MQFAIGRCRAGAGTAAMSNPGLCCVLRLSVKPAFQLFRAADTITVDEYLRYRGCTRDRTNGRFTEITVQNQFFEADAGIVQQALGAHTVGGSPRG